MSDAVLAADVDDAAAPAEPCGASLTPGELRSFLELGAAQLESAMKDADARMARLSSAVSHIVARLGELRAAVAELPNDAPPHRAALSERLGAMSAEFELDAQQAVVALQFYDKLVQRIAHVRDGLTIPAEAVAAGPLPRSATCEQLLGQVRSRYSMVEERVLFDFLFRGTGSREMMQALTSLLGASCPGELELF